MKIDMKTLVSTGALLQSMPLSLGGGYEEAGGSGVDVISGVGGVSGEPHGPVRWSERSDERNGKDRELLAVEENEFELEQRIQSLEDSGIEDEGSDSVSEDELAMALPSKVRPKRRVAFTEAEARWKQAIPVSILRDHNNLVEKYGSFMTKTQPERKGAPLVDITVSAEQIPVYLKYFNSLLAHLDHVAANHTTNVVGPLDKVYGEWTSHIMKECSICAFDESVNRYRRQGWKDVVGTFYNGLGVHYLFYQALYVLNENVNQERNKVGLNLAAKKTLPTDLPSRLDDLLNMAVRFYHHKQDRLWRSLWRRSTKKDSDRKVIQKGIALIQERQSKGETVTVYDKAAFQAIVRLEEIRLFLLQLSATATQLAKLPGEERYFTHMKMPYSNNKHSMVDSSAYEAAKETINGLADKIRCRVSELVRLIPAAREPSYISYDITTLPTEQQYTELSRWLKSMLNSKIDLVTLIITNLRTAATNYLKHCQEAISPHAGKGQELTDVLNEHLTETNKYIQREQKAILEISNSIKAAGVHIAADEFGYCYQTKHERWHRCLDNSQQAKLKWKDLIGVYYSDQECQRIAPPLPIKNYSNTAESTTTELPIAPPRVYNRPSSRPQHTYVPSHPYQQPGYSGASRPGSGNSYTYHHPSPPSSQQPGYPSASRPSSGNSYTYHHPSPPSSQGSGYSGASRSGSGNSYSYHYPSPSPPDERNNRPLSGQSSTPKVITTDTNINLTPSANKSSKDSAVKIDDNVNQTKPDKPENPDGSKQSTVHKPATNPNKATTANASAKTNTTYTANASAEKKIITVNKPLVKTDKPPTNKPLTTTDKPLTTTESIAEAITEPTEPLTTTDKPPTTTEGIAEAITEPTEPPTTTDKPPTTTEGITEAITEPIKPITEAIIPHIPTPEEELNQTLSGSDFSSYKDLVTNIHEIQRILSDPTVPPKDLQCFTSFLNDFAHIIQTSEPISSFTGMLSPNQTTPTLAKLINTHNQNLKELETINDAIDINNKDILAINASYHEATQTIDQKTSQITQNNIKLDDLINQNKQAEQAATDLWATVQNKRHQISNLTSSIAQATDLSNQLQQQLTDLGATLNNTLPQIEKTKVQLQELDKSQELQTSQAQLNQLKEDQALLRDKIRLLGSIIEIADFIESLRLRASPALSPEVALRQDIESLDRLNTTHSDLLFQRALTDPALNETMTQLYNNYLSSHQDAQDTASELQKQISNNQDCQKRQEDLEKQHKDLQKEQEDQRALFTTTLENLAQEKAKCMENTAKNTKKAEAISLSLDYQQVLCSLIHDVYSWATTLANQLKNTSNKLVHLSTPLAPSLMTKLYQTLPETNQEFFHYLIQSPSALSPYSQDIPAYLSKSAQVNDVCLNTQQMVNTTLKILNDANQFLIGQHLHLHVLPDDSMAKTKCLAEITKAWDQRSFNCPPALRANANIPKRTKPNKSQDCNFKL
ncbi:hypothetical protein NEHOM01_1375 [Nematocida homosporus]|uniref:uncharacterized protein n=1 Tax=Nematocida homosporus TaxID=1912981 RepID=UPI00221F2836|nr:uncharacterized protein NEHOM01_1375 [Nematocida homosporus]KAI5186311.1 hypothetical protein NEHOM01_1375 [Nematocida homosporus]